MSATTDHHDHPYLAHHFETPEQQFEAAKLGMWIFLLTEILFFAGLFVAYAVYRSHHPEMFAMGKEYLNPILGTLNTVMLLASSLTAAWAVRCSQLSQKKGLVLCLGLTLMGAGFFMGVKSIEYAAKWEEGALWPGAVAISAEMRSYATALWVLGGPWIAILLAASTLALVYRNQRDAAWFPVAVFVAGTAVAFLAGCHWPARSTR